MKHTTVTHEFLDTIPNLIEEGKIYISIPYATAVHKCCCGCGNEVVTPLSPTDWEVAFNGRTISLDPSIGNWNFPCQSHYWIKNNKVRWVRRWTREEIDKGRAQERLEKRIYFDTDESQKTLWSRIKGWLGR